MYLFLFFLLASLSFFSVRAMLACWMLSLVSVTLVLYRKRRLSIVKDDALFLLPMFIVLVFSVFHEVYLNYLIKYFSFFFMIMGLAVYVKSLDSPLVEIVRALKIFVLFHSLCFLVQLGVYLLVGEYIDFDSVIRERETKALYEARSLEGSALNIRATGLFSEPSFYSMVVLPALSIYLFVINRIDYTVVVGLLSVLLSFSLAGVAVSSIVVLFYCVKSRFILLLNPLSLVCVVLIFLMTPVFLDFYESRIVDQTDYDVVGSRLRVFEEFDVRGILKNLFGAGYLWEEEGLHGSIGLKGYEIRDSSFYIYTFYCSGFMGVLAFFCVLFFLFRKNIYILLLVVCFFLFKFHVMFFYLWVFLYISLIVSRYYVVDDFD